ncbi:hypothetical protein [Halocatena marina]|uniref:hypothetical protein n=1 Tax=Halocatena marina TaxID=2934937 RepID=UPI00200D7508|nr:hypothetical protein [Halocatena marina]
MGRIIYLDADGDRSEVTADTIKYIDDHWRFITDKYEEDNKEVTKRKWIPRERVIEVETKTEREKIF